MKPTPHSLPFVAAILSLLAVGHYPGSSTSFQCSAWTTPVISSVTGSSHHRTNGGSADRHSTLPSSIFQRPHGRDLASFPPTRTSTSSIAQSRKRTSTTVRSTTLDDDGMIETNEASRRQRRLVRRVEKFARLPVWPVWQGVFLFFASRIFGEETAASWENSIGGRVCPNFFPNDATSPFVMLVHHRHSFMSWDPVRYIQQTFFPEGFPAHPHRGFATVTYCLSGGMVHRDSQGMKQSYGAEARHGGNHVQWLTTGAGIQHEEMWDIEPDAADEGKALWTSSQELYQIWLNFPAAYKMSKPQAILLGGEDEAPGKGTTPVVHSREGSTVTTIVVGEHDGVRASVNSPSDAAIIRVEFEKKGATWTHSMPVSHETATVYVRSGVVMIGGERLPPHYTAYLGAEGAELVIEAPEGPADILLLSGAPLREPVASQGSMVMNTDQEIQQAYRDYQLGNMGIPWDHSLSDEEWREHIRSNPSKY